MQEATDSHQTVGDSDLSSPKAPAESARSLDSPCLSPGKSKKRERLDQSTTAGKKPQLMEEYTSAQKSDCAESIVDDGGGLANIAAVDQLLSKMKQEKSCSLQRITAAKALVATTRNDCLRKFVLLGGVSILEEWIQAGSRVRSSDAGMKDVDKGVDEEMMMILQALDKLPVSLETLKGCSIGKSVKQLRNVRNGEIQKRARKLVDTWRKRVDLEMKQSSTLSAAAPDCGQLVDSMVCASDLSPSKAVEANDQVAMKPVSMHTEEVNANGKTHTLVSTFSNTATSDGSPTNEHVKLVISPEKDASKKAARLSASSITSASSLSPNKKQKHSSLHTLDKDCKDDASNSLDFQKLKEKDLKGENSSSHAGSDTAARNTNEYRKKLRSGGSSAAPCSTDSNAFVSPCNAAQARDESDGKVACIDSNMGDSEQQQHVEVPNSCQEMDIAGTRAGNEVPGTPGTNDRDAGNEQGNAITSYPQDGKPDYMISCLSSQSSCSDKQNLAGPKLVLMAGNTSSSASPFHGDGKLYSESNPLSEQANDSSSGKEDMGHVSTTTISSENNHTDACAPRPAPKAEPNSNEIMANVMFERNSLANMTHVGEVGAIDCEESCCSHNTAKGGQVGGVVIAAQREVKVQQKVADFSPSHLAVHEGAGMLDGAKCSDACQEAAIEASNTTSTPSLAANGSNVSKSTTELDKAHGKALENPVVTQSCHDFDLNEGLAMDEFIHEIQPSCGVPPSIPKVTGTLSAPIAISAATKGVFMPPLNPSCKSDIGWRGSAATSAFRPAEPRHAPAKTQPSSTTEARNVNSFDLNVADLDVCEDCPTLSGRGLQEPHLDLNDSVKDNQTGASVLVGSPGKVAEKRTVLDFDLNEQLDEMPQEHEAHPTSAARSYDIPLPYGGLGGRASPGDVASWSSTELTSHAGTTAMGPRFELFCSGSSSQPVFSSRQATPTSIVPPLLPSVMYSQSAPFFGGSPQVPFPASFTYNSMSTGPDPSFMVTKGMPDSSFMVSKGMPGTAASSVGVRSRAETSLRPAFLTSIDDLRGSNNLYTWQRAPPNMYGNAGSTIISYNDAAAVGGREHVVGYEGNASSLEEQMRLFQQAAVPASSLRRRDPEYFGGLKQTTWH